MRAEPMFGDSVALWYCKQCQNSGALDVSDTSVYDVLEGMTEHHGALSKWSCRAVVGRDGIGIIRPIDWFREVQQEPADAR